MESLERALKATRLLLEENPALKATRLLLEENPAGNRHRATMNRSASKKPRRAFNFVLNALKANVPPGHHHELISDATKAIFVCHQNNEHAFKLVWNLYVIAQQYTGRRSSVDRVRDALDSFLHAFHVHPFAVSAGDSRVNLPTFAILNHNHETATRHKKLARRIGRAWVDYRAGDNGQVQDLISLQNLLFEHLWIGTVQPLKKHIAYLDDDSERLEFENAVEELERPLRNAVVCSKRSRFVVAFCGMVNAGTSMFLNAFMGRAILLSDGETNGSRTSPILD